MNSLHTWWRQRAPREQALLGAGLALVLVALLWALALAPALQTLRRHDARVAQLQATLGRMQALEAQARQLQGQARLDGASAQQALQTHTRTLLGPQAELTARMGGASVTLRAVSPQALGRWLASVRTEAHAKVVQSRLQRTAEGWSGSVQLALPE
jgi:general secretion pathway protein M